jgi:ubiquinone/menaquinone biosynthesis C-methylase UbiE
MDESIFCSGIYREVQDKGLSGWYINRSHIMLEKNAPANEGMKILEVGGNIGEHIRFVNTSFKNYTLTDYRDTKFVSPNEKIEFRLADVEALPFSDGTFDRTISTCLLHHVNNPEKAMREIRRVTRHGGSISLLIPCDPGMFYRFAKKFGVARKWKKAGIKNVDFYHYSQHRNHYPGLNSIVKEVFDGDEILIKNWPFPMNSWNFNLFTVYQISKSS